LIADPEMMLLLPAHWVAEASRKQVANSLDDYGYHWAIGRGTAFLADGRFTQPRSAVLQLVEVVRRPAEGCVPACAEKLKCSSPLLSGRNGSPHADYSNSFGWNGKGCAQALSAANECRRWKRIAAAQKASRAKAGKFAGKAA
jgi:hypothetical protein